MRLTNRASAGRLKRWESLLVALIAAIAVGLFTNYKLVRAETWYGDSAMYFQATENIARRGEPVSQVQAGIVDYIYTNRFVVRSAADIIAAPERLFGEAARGEYSLLAGHAYFILFPIALLVRVFPVTVVLLSLFVLSTFMTVALAYVALRRRSVPAAAAALFALLVMCHPALWESLLGGQFYPDRLFVFVGLLLMFLATRPDDETSAGISNKLWLGLTALVCASINERGAIVAGLFLLAHLALYRKRLRMDVGFRATLGVVSIAAGAAALKFMLAHNPEYGSYFPHTYAKFVAMIAAPQFAHDMTLFVLVEAPFLVLAAFEWRAAAIAILLMLPNVLGTQGGSEKIGWFTHYPSFFLPALVWAAACGCAALFGPARPRSALRAGYAGMAAAIVYLLCLDPNATAPIRFGLPQLAVSAPLQMTAAIHDFVLDRRFNDAVQAAAAGLRAAVPPGSTVSSVEGGMGLLYRGRNIQFFPMDIDHADYAVIGASVAAGTIVFNGAVNYAGPSDANDLMQRTLERMKTDGYDLAHPQLFPAFTGLAVVKRVH